MGAVLNFPGVSKQAGKAIGGVSTPPTPAPRPAHPIAPPGADVYLCDEESGAYSVHDESRSGSSAGHHGYFGSYDDAAAEARRIALAIGGRFHDLTDTGGAA